MRSINAARIYPPTKEEELANFLSQSRKRLSRIDFLSFLVACKEFDSWLNDSREYNERTHAVAWKEVAKEVEHSFNFVGSRLLAFLEDEVNRLRDLAKIVPGDIEKIRSGARVATEDLLSRAACSDAVKAAWLDFSEACANDKSTYSIICFRRDLFLQIVEHSKKSPQEVGWNLSSILDDQKPLIQSIRSRIFGDEVVESLARRDEPAGLSSDEIGDLCLEYLAEKPKQHNHVVWFLVRATGGCHQENLGKFQIFGSELLISLLERKSIEDISMLPDEMKEFDPWLSSEDLPSGEDDFFVRVELGQRLVSDPITVARRKLDALFELAALKSGRKMVKVWEGYIYYADSELSSWQSFSQENMSQVDFYHSQILVEEVRSISPLLENSSILGEGDISEILEAARWWLSSADVVPAVRLVSHVHVMELVSSRLESRDWFDYANYYFKGLWVRSEATNYFLSSVMKSCEVSFRNLPIDVKLEARSLARSLKVPWEDGRGYSIDVEKSVSVMERMVALLPPHSMERRRLLDCSIVYRKNRDLKKWVRNLESIWDLNIKRVRRTRNSVAHGGPLEEGVVKATIDFSRRISFWSLHCALEQELGVKSLRGSHEDLRRRGGSWRGRIWDAQSFEKSFFS